MPPAKADSTCPGMFRLRRPDGSEYEAILPRSFDYAFAPLAGQPVWQKRELAGGCTFGVVDMARLQPEEVDSALNELRDTDALVFDIRNYPNGTVGPLIDRLFDRSYPSVRITRPVFTHPGNFFSVELAGGGARPIDYDGPLPMLHDERSISHAEFTVMTLQASGKAITFGSQTAAADGNITEIQLPGGLFVNFTGLGVFYPDGRPTQRIGSLASCQLPLLLSVQSPVTALWAGPASDAGWGLSVHHDDGVLTVIVYAYDNAGAPRWLLAQKAWNGSGAVQLNLQRMRGACRACAGAAPQPTTAGTMTLNLDGVTTGRAEDNWVTLDARFDVGAAWVRDRLPLRRVTGPAR